MGGFAAELRAEHDSIWRSIHEHPFLTGIRDGTLPIARFEFYLRQDYVYLIQYCRLIALACARSYDPTTMARFADLLGATLNTEMELHRRYCARFGVSSVALASEAPAPTTYAYTSHLLATAYQGSELDLIGALLPCQVGYYELGVRLKREASQAGTKAFGEWIDTYASPEYADLGAWLLSVFDALAERASPAEHERVRSLYGISCRYEYAFWQMAWNGEPLFPPIG